MTDKDYTAADFEGVKLAEHPDGRTAARYRFGSYWCVMTAPGAAGLIRGSDWLADEGFVPVSLVRLLELESTAAAQNKIAEEALTLAKERLAANGILENAVKALQKKLDEQTAKIIHLHTALAEAPWEITLDALASAWERAEEGIPRKGDTVIAKTSGRDFWLVFVTKYERSSEDEGVRILRRGPRRPDGAEAIEAALIDLTGDARAAALEEINEGQDDLAADRIAYALAERGYTITKTEEEES